MNPELTSKVRIAGFGLLEVLIGTAVLGTLGLTIASMGVSSSKQEARLEFSSGLQQLSQQLSAEVNDPSAWAMTVQMAPTGAANSLSCLNSGGCLAATTYAPFTLYNADGSIADNSPNPSAGFNSSGSQCLGYTAAGSNACPVRVELDWQAQCNTASDPSCVHPVIMIQANFQFSPSPSSDLKYGFNMSKYSFILTRSAIPVLGVTTTTATAATPANTQICTYLGGTVDASSGACTLPPLGGIHLSLNGIGNIINMADTLVLPDGSTAKLHVNGVGENINLGGLPVTVSGHGLGNTITP